MGGERRTGDSQTKDVPERASRGAGTGPPDDLALVIVWSAAEPDRIGEVFVPRREAGSPALRTIGRGVHKHPTKSTLSPVRQRPGRTEEAPPLEDPCLSREHLELASDAGDVTVRCVGRHPMRVNGQPLASAVVREGDLIEIEDVLSLLCVRRPAFLPPMRHGAPDDRHAFGLPDPHEIVGESRQAWDLRDAIVFAGARAAHVLVLGESGSGKELVGHAIHAASSRAPRKLVARNAATFPSGLVDSELFGNCANYPQSGMPERLGLVGEADGGSLLLDEIGDMPQELQAHLLRFMDQGEYQRLGDSRRRRADVRVICATNRPLATMRQELAERLPLRVVVPALSTRREDIPLLVRHLLGRLCGGSPRRVGQELISRLVRAPLGGNVRTLEAVLLKAIEKSDGGVLEWPEGAITTPGPGASSRKRHVPGEREVRAALDRNQGVQSRAWKDLGLPSRYALLRLMRRYRINGSD